MMIPLQVPSLNINVDGYLSPQPRLEFSIEENTVTAAKCQHHAFIPEEVSNFFNKYYCLNCWLRVWLQNYKGKYQFVTWKENNKSCKIGKHDKN